MANKNIQMKHKNGTDWDNMYPITLINNIFDTDGNNLKAYIANKINYIDIRDYGAKGDGLTDDSAALVSAINELNAKGGILRIPKGTFRIGMNIVPNIIRSGCYIEGDGEGSSVLLMTDYYVSHNFLQFGDDTKDTVRDVGIRKLTIQYNTQTAGCAVKFTNVQKFFVKDAEVNSAYNAFDIGSTANENSNFCYMENVIGGVSHCAFNIIGGCNGFHLVNIQFNSEFSNVGAIGMQLPLSGNLDTMYIDNCLFQRFHYGIMANGTSGTLQNFFFTNLVVDATKVYSLYFSPSGSQIVTRFSISNSWFTSLSEDCIILNATSTACLDGVHFDGCRFINAYKRSVVLQSPYVFNVGFNNCVMSGGSVVGSGAYSAIMLNTGSRKFKITNCRIGNEGQTTANQKYGIEISPNCDEYLIANNDLIGNVAGGIGDNYGTFTKKLIADNLGYNPLGAPNQPTLPASGVEYKNAFSTKAQVILCGGVVTQVLKNGYIINGMTSGTIILAPNESINITYTTAPTWTWFLE